jgi:7-cyano-7-deazaguanine synthase
MGGKERALVVFSGGQDSTICLYWALRKFGRGKVHAVTFDYGQRHRIELNSARTISRRAGVPLTLLPINTFGDIGGNALTGRIPVKNRKSARALPNTFVPGRNIIFLAFAAALAYREGIHHLVAGVCEADYSGYPDCRDRAIRSLQKTLELGMDYGIRIHTPLIYMTKARALRLAKRLGAYEALAHSHTCYNNRRPPCGKCQACRLRAKAFRQAGMRDPLTRTTSARNIPKPAEARCTAPGNRRPIPGSP